VKAGNFEKTRQNHGFSLATLGSTGE